MWCGVLRRQHSCQERIHLPTACAAPPFPACPIHSIPLLPFPLRQARPLRDGNHGFPSGTHLPALLWSAVFSTQCRMPVGGGTRQFFRRQIFSFFHGLAQLLTVAVQVKGRHAPTGRPQGRLLKENLPLLTAPTEFTRVLVVGIGGLAGSIGAKSFKAWAQLEIAGLTIRARIGQLELAGDSAAGLARCWAEWRCP